MFNKKKSGKNSFGRIIKLAIVTIVVLVALSLQASACHIGDRVWNDLDMDGIQERGEPGITGVTVKLYDNAGNYLKKTVTNKDGYYNFAVSKGCTYKLKFVLPDGYVFSPKNQGSNDYLDSDARLNGRTGDIYIKYGIFYKNWDAGMYQTAGLGNYVWNDVNNDGVQDENEPGISGVEVQLFDANGVVPATPA